MTTETETTPTVAQQISALFDDDGQTYRAYVDVMHASGELDTELVSIDEVCADHERVDRQTRNSDGTLYVFSDGSAVFVNFSGVWCTDADFEVSGWSIPA